MNNEVDSINRGPNSRGPEHDDSFISCTNSFLVRELRPVTELHVPVLDQGKQHPKFQFAQHASRITQREQNTRIRCRINTDSAHGQRIGALSKLLEQPQNVSILVVA